MSAFLQTLSKGASYMVWGTTEDEKNVNTNANTNINGNQNVADNNNNTNTNSANLNSSKVEVFGSAKGELWKYSEKNENFKLIMREVEVRIVEPEDNNNNNNNNDFLCCFEILKKNGALVLREPLTNDLQIQYNRSDHSMLFSIINEKDDKVSVLQFIFSTPHDENELKWKIGVKLMEYNRQEAFVDLIKKKEFDQENDKDYICNQYENAAENDNYEEDEIDWRDLDEDVVMRNFANLSISDNTKDDENKHDNDNDNNNSNDNDNDDNNDEDEEDDDDEDEEKTNVWEKAANKKLSKNEMNRYITNAKAFNRSYVIRETKPGQSVLGYFKHNNDNELIYKGKVELNDINGDTFTPYKAMQFKSDRNMLLLSDQKPGTISVFNVDRGKVVEEWNGKNEDNGGTLDIAPLSKFDELTDNTQLYGLNKNSLFLMDGRINKQNKLVDSRSQTYKTRVGMNTITTTGQGFIATGSDKGQIRLYDCVNKRAKTLLPGLGSSIKHIETTNDGKWLLSTCDKYIMLIPTVVAGTERLGYTGRGMGKSKPKPYVLKLKASDIAKYKIRNINFTPAHFDTSNESTFEEHWIVTSTGPFIIKWNFNKLKKCGICNSYSIRRAKTKVMHNQFRFKYGDDLLVSETDNVYAQHSSKHNKK